MTPEICAAEKPATHDNLPDTAFFTPLDGAAIRPDGAYHFEGPQGRYTLTWRQEAFARHYAACGNGAEAARRAGYSVTSARFIAHENLQNSKLRWRIRALAAQAEAQRRDETTYLLRMLNAAMEMALVQGQPNAMIRALAQMARLAGLDRQVVTTGGTKAGDTASDTAGDMAADDLAVEAAHALLPSISPGLLRDAILGPAENAVAGGVAGGAAANAPDVRADLPAPKNTPARTTHTHKAHAVPASPGPLPNIPQHSPTDKAILARGPARRKNPEALIGSGPGAG
jgi:phage terminase small subunit